MAFLPSGRVGGLSSERLAPPWARGARFVRRACALERSRRRARSPRRRCACSLTRPPVRPSALPRGGGTREADQPRGRRRARARAPPPPRLFVRVRFRFNMDACASSASAPKRGLRSRASGPRAKSEERELGPHLCVCISALSAARSLANSTQRWDMLFSFYCFHRRGCLCSGTCLLA